jgi:hypothetical protein
MNIRKKKETAIGFFLLALPCSVVGVAAVLEHIASYDKRNIVMEPIAIK